MVTVECAAYGVHQVDLEPGEWAEEFATADAVTQEQMMANLRLLCPHLTIEFRK